MVTTIADSRQSAWTATTPSALPGADGQSTTCALSPGDTLTLSTSSPDPRSPWQPFLSEASRPAAAGPAEAFTPPVGLLDPAICSAIGDDSTPLSLRHRVGLGLALALSLAGTVTLAGCSPGPSTTQSATQTTLKLVDASDPVLHQPAQPVPEVDATVRRTLDDMECTMHRQGGIGLAAPQVGIPMRMIVVDVGDGPVKLVNPSIASRSGDVLSVEGCLSLPNRRYTVHRASTVVVKGTDENGRSVTLESKGLQARAFQHEIDHLDGITIADRAASGR